MEPTQQLAVPTLHLNGTSKERLIEPLADAYDKLEAAYQALKQAGPNGRDYYPQGDGAFAEASRQHMARLLGIDEVKASIQAIIEAIEDGGHRN